MRNGRRDGSRGRHRNMFELTGTPGWIRFGSSPGFAGGGAGRGPCAEYLEKTGQLDEFVKDFIAKNPAGENWINTYSQFTKANPDFEKDRLNSRIKMLEDELKELKKQLKEYR